MVKREEDARATWQTKTLSMFIASTIDTGGQANTLVAEAGKVSLLEEDLDPKMASRSRPIENQPGSFERLAAMGWEG